MSGQLRSLHLNINILNKGVFGGAWRLPGTDPLSSYGIQHYIDVARAAEDAAFDAAFLADTLVPEGNLAHRPANSLEPSVVLSRLAAETTRLGLIATVSSTYSDPSELALRLATIDVLSSGRLGWNVVTTAGAAPAANFGLPGEPPRDLRYGRAEAVTGEVLRLWRSGELPRSAQGHPLIVQAGGSPQGVRLAGRFADAVFSVAQTIDDNLAHASRLDEAAEAANRPRGSIVNLPGLSTVVARTDAEAQRRRVRLDELLPLAYALPRLSAQLGIDLSEVDLDERPGEDDLGDPSAGGSRGFNEAVREVIRRQRPSYRELLRHLGGGAGHHIVVGSPETIADHIEDWHRRGRADGFNLMPDVLPEGFEQFIELVVPELRRRGLFRHEYEETTLRERYGAQVEQEVAA